MSFSQNFHFFTIKFLSITKFFPPPLTAKIVIKKDCFWYVWTDKPQNFSLRTSFEQCNGNWLPYKVFSLGVVQWTTPRVITYLPDPVQNRVKGWPYINHKISINPAENFLIFLACRTCFMITHWILDQLFTPNFFP